MPTTFAANQGLSAAALTAALATATSDAVATPVTATTSTVPRAMAARFAETRNVLDFGANPAASGAGQDSLTAFAAAQFAAQSNGGGTVKIPFGTYWLSGTVYSADGVTFEIDPGVVINGPGQILGLDDAIQGNFGKVYAKFTNSTNGEFAIYGSVYVGATTGNVAYEKAALFGRIKTGDSTISGYNKESVAIQGIAETAAGTTLGRIWGADYNVTVTSGSDSYAHICEGGINNYGAAQPLVDQTNSKIGYDAISSGPNNNTAAFIVNGGGSGYGSWEHGIFVKDVAINTYAFTLNTYGGGWTAIAYIKKNGDSLFRTVQSTLGIGAFGHAPPSTQPARCVTLADVIAVLAGNGTTA